MVFGDRILNGIYENLSLVPIVVVKLPSKDASDETTVVLILIESVSTHSKLTKSVRNSW